MKAGLFTLAAVALLQLAIAQPHGVRRRHRHHNRQAVVTDVDYLIEEIVVYVDDDGKPVSTGTIFVDITATTTSSTTTSSSSSSTTTTSSTATSTTTTTTPTPVAVSTPTTLATSTSTSTSTSTPPPPPSTTSKPLPAPSTTAAPAYTPPAYSAPAAPAAPVSKASSSSAPAAAPVQSPSAPSTGSGFGKGVTYSPYNQDNTCKGKNAVAMDLAGLSGHDTARIYGTDCNQVANVLSAIKGTSMGLLVGIFDLGSIQSEAQIIIDAVKGDWSKIKGVSVGNELVDTGAASVSQVVSAMSQARSILRAAGYNGNVFTVDTMVAMKNNPELCLQSDGFCAINCHAFFSSITEAKGAGDFVQGWIKQVSDAANGKPVVVTETGWPTKGNANGAAVPSLENQGAAISSITSAVSSNVFLYSLYDMPWKTTVPATFNAEPYWGMQGTAKSGAINTS